MGLETFNFIPDLVDTNPAPTDPVAQGDDHLRGIKFTLQNQWPVIGENQVDRTALQMNDAALRSEANIFTDVNTFNNDNLIVEPLIADDNAQVIYNDENGFVRWQLGRANTTTSGDFRLRRFDAAGLFLDNPIEVGAGNGFMKFNTASASFFGQALRIETAATPSTTVQTAINYIGGANTLRWAIARQADSVTGDLVINRHDSNGTLQNTIMRWGNDGVVTVGSGTLTQQIEAGGAQLSFNFANDAGISRWGFLYSSVTGELTIHPRSATGSLEGAILRMDSTGSLFMDRLPIGPTGKTKEIYAKQSQTFIGTELVLGQSP